MDLNGERHVSEITPAVIYAWETNRLYFAHRETRVLFAKRIAAKVAQASVENDHEFTKALFELEAKLSTTSFFLTHRTWKILNMRIVSGIFFVISLALSR